MARRVRFPQEPTVFAVAEPKTYAMSDPKPVPHRRPPALLTAAPGEAAPAQASAKAQERPVAHGAGAGDAPGRRVDAGAAARDALTLPVHPPRLELDASEAPTLHHTVTSGARTARAGRRGFEPTEVQRPPGGATKPASRGMRRAGRYLIRERLGSGGMGTVYRARDPDIGRDLAIKFLHPALCVERESRGRFLREARAAGRLSHPNIVTVHDVGEIDGSPYMAMELLHGRPLADELKPGAPLPVREAATIAAQLARALGYAHDRGVVHRDIKPGNIVRLAGTPAIKVTDFGIAHLESPGTAYRTRAGLVLGTPQYMSPEQAQGGRLDGRSDIFSAGVVLYEMLAGRRPFEGDSLVAVAVRIARDEHQPVDRLNPEVPASLARVVDRCLAKAPEDRFRTGGELADALDAVLSGIERAEREQDAPRVFALRAKWAGAMALVVALVMGATALVLGQRQYAAMLEQAIDSGAAVTRLVAAQNALAALAEDWVAVEVAVQEAMKAGGFSSLHVSDRHGIVRAAGDPAWLGRHDNLPAVEPFVHREGSVAVSRHVADGASVLDFRAPITFQGKRVGTVVLGLSEAPLARVARRSIALVVLLVAVTVVAAGLAAYGLADAFGRPLERLREAMGEVARGRLEHRIGTRRNDEIGLLYAAFDDMAQALQARRGGGAAPGTGSAFTTAAASQSANPLPPAPTQPPPEGAVGAPAPTAPDRA